MKTKTALIVQLITLTVSVTSLAISINAKRDFDQKMSAMVESSQRLLDESVEKQMERNKILVKFNESVGENLMNLTGRIAVLEAKNIVRGE